MESRIQVRIEPGHAVMWLTEYTSMLLNRYEVSRGGKTAYERCKGKPPRLMGLESGESVMWRRKSIGNNLAKVSVLSDKEIGEMEANVEKDPWDERAHKEYGDGEFDPRLVREARTEEV